MLSANFLEPTCFNAIAVTETNSDQVHDTEPDSDQSHEPIFQEHKSEQQVTSSSIKKNKTDFINFSLSKNKYEELFVDFLTLKRAGIANIAHCLLKIFMVQHALQTKLVTLVTI